MIIRCSPALEGRGDKGFGDASQAKDLRDTPLAPSGLAEEEHGMRKRQALVLSGLMVLSACAPPQGPPAPMAPADRAVPGAPSYDIQQLRTNISTLLILQRIWAAEDKIVDLINAERKANGVRQLFNDRRVRQAARLHVLDEVKNDWFGNVSPTGLNWWTRMSSTGLRWFSSGILHRVVGPPPETAGQRVMYDDPDGWMSNDADRRHVLQPLYNSVGVGVMWHPTERQFYVVAYMIEQNPPVPRELCPACYPPE
jgi:uncharacterized protein YkwD